MGDSCSTAQFLLQYDIKKEISDCLLKTLFLFHTEMMEIMSISITNFIYRVTCYYKPCCMLCNMFILEYFLKTVAADIFFNIQIKFPNYISQYLI